MSEPEDIVAGLVAASDGRLVGRVRLQKTLYLLERLGLETGLSFEYHHYGPYSRALDNATADAKAFGLVEESFEHRQSDGAMFSIFRLKQGARIDGSIYGALGRDRAKELVRRFANTNVTVLELAATIDWLWQVEHYEDWRSEIKRRKGKKVLGGRLDKAIDLLQSLNLAPPSSVPA